MMSKLVKIWKNSRYLVLWIGFCLILAPFSLLKAADEQCLSNLRTAENYLEAGRLSEIPDLLRECLRKSDGFTKEEQIQAYRLLAISYIYMDRPGLAEENYLSILRNDPEYRISVNDPIEFRYFEQRYKSAPYFSYQFRLGFNTTFVQNLVVHNMQANMTSMEAYQNNLGVDIAAGLEYHLNTSLKIGLETQFSFYSYTMRDSVLGFSVLAFREQNAGLRVPVYVKYSLGNRPIKPYILLGVVPEFMFSSTAQVTRDVFDAEGGQVRGVPINLMEAGIRSGMNFSGMAGLGVSFKRGLNHMFVDARLVAGLHNRTKGANRFANNAANAELLHRYHYVSNDMIYHQAVLSFGYSRTVFRTKKIKSYDQGL